MLVGQGLELFLGRGRRGEEEGTYLAGSTLEVHVLTSSETQPMGMSRFKSGRPEPSGLWQKLSLHEAHNVGQLICLSSPWAGPPAAGPTHRPLIPSDELSVIRLTPRVRPQLLPTAIIATPT